MRILQVCPRYYPAIGGVEEHVKNISERLAKEHQVTVFTGDPSGKLPPEEEINGVRVKRFRSFAPGDAYHLSLQMAQALRKSQFDIVHAHNYHALPLYFSQYAKAGKLVVTPHYHGHGHTRLRDLLLRLYKPLGARALARARTVIAVSRYEKEQLLQDFRLETNRIVIIPNGVDLREFRNLETVPKEPKTILYVGRLKEYKGVQYILEALPLLDNDFQLDIVGKGPYKGKLIGMANELGLSQRVRFYQDVPRHELLRMYARAGVLVLLSRHESFSIVVAEALAAGTPCIVANTSALSEWIDGKNCFGLKYPVQPDELARLIVRVAGIKVTGVQLWDWDQVAQQVAQTYLDC